MLVDLFDFGLVSLILPRVIVDREGVLSFGGVVESSSPSSLQLDPQLTIHFFELLQVPFFIFGRQG